MRNKHAQSFLVVTLILLPIFLTILTIEMYGARIPLADQWDSPGTALEHYLDGNMTPEILFSQHNESRKAVTRALWMINILLFGWNVRVELYMTVAAVCVISIILLQLLMKSSTFPKDSVIWIWALLNVLLFGLASWEYWLWGISIEAYIPALALVLGILLNSTQLNGFILWVFFGILSFLATYSYANGLILWPLLFLSRAMRWIDCKNYTKYRWAESLGIVSFITMATISLWFYFRDYYSPPYHPGIQSGIEMPFTSLLFFINWLSAPLTNNLGPIVGLISIPVGMVVLVFIVFVSIEHFINGIRHRDFSMLRVWGPILAYAVVSGGLTAMGRSQIDAALWKTSRYVCFSVFAYLGVIPLCYVSLSRLGWLRNTLGRTGRFCVQNTLFLLVIIMSFANSAGSIPSIIRESVRYQQSETELSLWLSGFQKPILPGYPHAKDNVYRRIMRLDSEGLLPINHLPKDVYNMEVNEWRVNGQFEQISVEKEYIVAYGWCASHGRHRENMYLLVVGYKDGTFLPIYAQPHNYKPPARVGDKFNYIKRKDYGFEIRIPNDRLPKEALQMRIYALSTSDLSIDRLPGSFDLPKR